MTEADWRAHEEWDALRTLARNQVHTEYDNWPAPAPRKVSTAVIIACILILSLAAGGVCWFFMEGL